MTATAVQTRMFRFALDQAMNDVLGFERGLGYWITHRGDIVPLPPGVTHAEIAERLLIGEGGVAPTRDALSDAEGDAMVADINAFAIDHGWSRVRIYPADRVVYIDFGRGMRSQHEGVLDRLLESLQMEHYRVQFTDDMGGYRELNRPS